MVPVQKKGQWARTALVIFVGFEKEMRELRSVNTVYLRFLQKEIIIGCIDYIKLCHSMAKPMRKFSPIYN